jgi:hypothetical protein
MVMESMLKDYYMHTQNDRDLAQLSWPPEG